MPLQATVHPVWVHPVWDLIAWGHTQGSLPSLFLSLMCSSLQFGHLFAKGDTREAAIRAMVVALKEVKIRGEIRTIVDYAVEMIQSADFVGNSINTGWLDARIASHVRAAYPASIPFGASA